MKLIFAVALLVLSCGSDAVTPPPPEFERRYALSSLVYEDVVPGTYAAALTSYSGSAKMEFGDVLGQLVVPNNVQGVITIVFPDSSIASADVVILPKGTFSFTFSVDSAGVVTFQSGPPLWPVQSGAVLSDSSYSYDHTQCYNDGCTDYIKLAFSWTRLP